VGRKADWMAPHLVYLPEVKVNPDKFLSDCDGLLQGNMATSSSRSPKASLFADSDLAKTSDKVDEFGHSRLGGVAEALGKMVEDAIGARVRTDKAGQPATLLRLLHERRGQ